MPDGTRYLFAYNPRNAAVDATWTLAEPGREVSEPGGAASTRPDDSRLATRLATRLAPYEVRRYPLRRSSRRITPGPSRALNDRGGRGGSFRRRRRSCRARGADAAV